MTNSINIELFSKDSTERSELITSLIEADGGRVLSQSSIDELVMHLKAPTSSKFAKSSIAYLLGRLKIMDAVPALAAAFGEQWVSSGDSPVFLRCNPDTALLYYGPAVRPVIEDFLATTQRADLVTLATIMIFNVTGSKAEAKKSLLAAMEARPATDHPLFEDALKGIEVWKE